MPQLARNPNAYSQRTISAQRCYPAVLPDAVSRCILNQHTKSIDIYCEKAIAPKLATPQLLLLARTAPKYLARRPTLDRSHHFRHAIRWNALHQKMHMISTRSNF